MSDAFAEVCRETNLRQQFAHITQRTIERFTWRELRADDTTEIEVIDNSTGRNQFFGNREGWEQSAYRWTENQLARKVAA
jgi:hypothetical protein